MGRNNLSEVGQAEELIRSFIQFGCAEIHAKGLYEKATAALENGLVDVEDNEVLQKQLDKCEQYRQDIDTYANLRRNAMRILFQMFDGDRDEWCIVKHLGIGAMQMFEVYQASDNDAELLNLAYEANTAFIGAISRFLGMEIESCASCLSDALRSETNGQIV